LITLVLTLLAVSIKDAPVEEITELPSGLPRKQTQATQKYTTEHYPLVKKATRRVAFVASTRY